MILGFFNKRKEKKQAIIDRKKKLQRIDVFPLGDEWKASDKKKLELQELISFLIDLVDNHDFIVKRSWGRGLPKDCYLRRDYGNAEISLETYVDVSGQNHDRVGKISLGLEWNFEGVYNEKKDTYVGEIDKSKECSLKVAKKILPEIIQKFEEL